MFLFSCTDFYLSEEEKQEKLVLENKDLMMELDSIMSIEIEVPLLIDSSFIAIECLDQFNQLARETNGGLKVVSNSRYVAKVVSSIIESNIKKDSDLMIIMDKTGSMSDDINNLKIGLDQILETLKKYDSIRLAVATYGDKNVDKSAWFEFKNFDTDFEETMEFIENIKITGGGDYPESVYDGIYEAFQNDFWRSNSKRMVILLGDAPSLDSSLSDHTIEEIIEIATSDSINMNFYPVVLSPSDMGFVMDVPKMQNLTFIESVYPNPSNGLLTINLNQFGEFRFELFDQNGTLLRERMLECDTCVEELYEFQNGIYLIRISDENMNFDTRKIILRM